MMFYLRLILFIMLSCPLYAEQTSIVLLAEKDSPALNKLYKNLQTIAPGYKYSISTKNSPITVKTDDFVILVGSKVPSYFSVSQHKRSIGVLVTQQQALELETQTSIWVEPPLSRQLKLGDLVVPGDEKIGLLVTNEKNKAEQLSRLNSSQKEMLKVVNLSDYENINQALFNVLKGTRLLLGSYDNRIYNAKNIKNILITSYRQQKVLIGPSRAYLKAGSFATTFSDLSHVAMRILDVVNNFQKTGRWLAADYNPYYRILFNQQVARSLNIRVMNDKVLKERMREGS